LPAGTPAGVLYLLAVAMAGCYTETTTSRGMGKDGFRVNRAAPSTISDAKTDPMILTPPPKSRMAW